MELDKDLKMNVTASSSMTSLSIRAMHRQVPVWIIFIMKIHDQTKPISAVAWTHYKKVDTVFKLLANDWLEKP